MKHCNVLQALCLVFLVIVSGVLFAQNPNCTIVVPAAPLTAAGLATPYQLLPTDTNPDDGSFVCHETNASSSAFVQAAILDPATGQISIYNPLVIDQGSIPALGITPVVPNLPDHAVVALWFGFNGNVLTQGGDAAVLAAANCVNGLPNNEFGQFSYCNAPAFFKAANRAIREGKLRVPRLGYANDHLPCPTVRDFYVVDQDQSDNLPVTYLVEGDLLAQNNLANHAALNDPKVLGNPSDNGLVDRFLDPALGCTPWKVDDLADPGQKVPGLALNELQARAYQRGPIALIPAGDPMVLDGNGDTDLAKVNAYRRGVDQPEVRFLWQADTARYCRDMLRIAPARLLLDQVALTAAKSPVPVASNLFTFLAQRFTGSYDILGCGDLVHIDDPITVILDGGGIATDATINLPKYNRCKRNLAPWDRQDGDADDAAQAAAATN
jgi:hypothetical protein